MSNRVLGAPYSQSAPVRGRGRTEHTMDDELKALLERSRSVELSPEQIEENRIELAAANDQLTDKRITVSTMKATRTIMLADEAVPA